MRWARFLGPEVRKVIRHLVLDFSNPYVFSLRGTAASHQLLQGVQHLVLVHHVDHSYFYDSRHHVGVSRDMANGLMVSADLARLEAPLPDWCEDDPYQTTASVCIALACRVHVCFAARAYAEKYNTSEADIFNAIEKNLRRLLNEAETKLKRERGRNEIGEMDHPKRVNIMTLKQYIETEECEGEFDAKDIEKWV